MFRSIGINQRSHKSTNSIFFTREVLISKQDVKEFYLDLTKATLAFQPTEACLVKKKFRFNLTKGNTRSKRFEGFQMSRAIHNLLSQKK